MTIPNPEVTSYYNTTVSATLDGTPVVIGSTVTGLTLGDGVHTVLYTAKDTQGNTASAGFTSMVGPIMSNNKRFLCQCVSLRGKVQTLPSHHT